MELLEYDSVSQRVRGTFDIHFRVQEPWDDNSHLPKRVHYADGYFDIMLQQ